MTPWLLIAYAIGVISGGFATAWVLMVVAIANGKAAGDVPAAGRGTRETS